jgi:regulator of ribonuclease activity B
MRATDLESVVAGHVARNRELCKVIEGKGADLAAVRPIDLHFWADGEVAAHRLAGALRGRGWSRVELDPTEDEGVWNVEVQIDRSVLEVVDLGFTEELAKLAMDNQSEFDGWGTSV